VGARDKARGVTSFRVGDVGGTSIYIENNKRLRPRHNPKEGDDRNEGEKECKQKAMTGGHKVE